MKREESETHESGDQVRRHAWIMWTLAATFIFYQFMLQVSPSAMLSALETAYQADVVMIGRLVSVFYIAFALMLIPVGYLMDEYNKRFLMAGGLLLCLLGCFVMAISQEIVQAYLARALMGAGGAFAFVGTMRLVVVWFSKGRVGWLSGLTVASAMLGALFGQRILYRFVIHFGWRMTFVLVGCVGLLLMFLMLLVLRDDPSSPSIRNSTPYNLLTKLLQVARNKENWKAALFAGLIYLPLPTFAGLWASPFLTELYGVSYQSSLQTASLIWVGMAIGSPLLGLLSDKLGNPRVLMMISSLLLWIVLLYLLSGRVTSQSALDVLFCLIGFLCGVYSLAFSVLHTINSIELSSLSVGFAMTIVMLVTASVTQAVGLILRLSHMLFNASQLSYFTASDYQVAILLIPVLLFVSQLIAGRVPKFT